MHILLYTYYSDMPPNRQYHSDLLPSFHPQNLPSHIPTLPNGTLHNRTRIGITRRANQCRGDMLQRKIRVPETVVKDARGYCADVFGQIERRGYEKEG